MSWKRLPAVRPLGFMEMSRGGRQGCCRSRWTGVGSEHGAGRTARRCVSDEPWMSFHCHGHQHSRPRPRLFGNVLSRKSLALFAFTGKEHEEAGLRSDLLKRGQGSVHPRRRRHARGWKLLEPVTMTFPLYSVLMSTET